MIKYFILYLLAFFCSISSLYAMDLEQSSEEAPVHPMVQSPTPQTGGAAAEEHYSHKLASLGLPSAIQGELGKELDVVDPTFRQDVLGCLSKCFPLQKSAPTLPVKGECTHLRPLPVLDPSLALPLLRYFSCARRQMAGCGPIKRCPNWFVLEELDGRQVRLHVGKRPLGEQKSIVGGATRLMEVVPVEIIPRFTSGLGDIVPSFLQEVSDIPDTSREEVVDATRTYLRGLRGAEEWPITVLSVLKQTKRGEIPGVLHCIHSLREKTDMEPGTYILAVVVGMSPERRERFPEEAENFLSCFSRTPASTFRTKAKRVLLSRVGRGTPPPLPDGPSDRDWYAASLLGLDLKLNMRYEAHNPMLLSEDVPLEYYPPGVQARVIALREAVVPPPSPELVRARLSHRLITVLGGIPPEQDEAIKALFRGGTTEGAQGGPTPDVIATLRQALLPLDETDGEDGEGSLLEMLLV